jgi:hypothetical protein
MRVLAINGSPRKSGRTVELLEGDLEAVRRAGAETKLVHLADYDIRRCRGCYACSERVCPQRAGIAQAGHSGGTEPSCSNAGEWKRPWMARRFRKGKWPRHNMGFRIHWPYSARTSRLAEVKDMWYRVLVRIPGTDDRRSVEVDARTAGSARREVRESFLENRSWIVEKSERLYRATPNRAPRNLWVIMISAAIIVLAVIMVALV